MECPYCKEEIQEGALKCKHCGSMLTPAGAPQAATSEKSKVTAGVLALLLGGFGIHKFYLGAWGWGVRSAWKRAQRIASAKSRI